MCKTYDMYFERLVIALIQSAEDVFLLPGKDFNVKRLVIIYLIESPEKGFLLPGEDFIVKNIVYIL